MEDRVAIGVYAVGGLILLGGLASWANYLHYQIGMPRIDIKFLNRRVYGNDDGIKVK